MTERARDILFVVHLTGPWDGFHRRPLISAIASALPDTAAILVVDRPITLDATPVRHPRRFLRDVWRTRELVDPHTGIAMIRPRLPFHDLTLPWMPALAAINRALLHTQLAGCTARKSHSETRIVEWVYHPCQNWVLGLPRAVGVVYECYDEHSLTSTGKQTRWTQNREAPLLNRADCVFVTSEALAEQRRPKAKHLEVIPNGAPSIFLKHHAPSETQLSGIPRPRIGCLGNFRALTDSDLLADIFQAEPGWNLVIVGPIDRSARIERLRTLANVHFLGGLPQHLLPSVLSGLDVGLIPLRLNGFTRALNPLKLYEYLAAGLPVVSSDIPEVHRFEGTIQIVANNPADYREAIRVYLQTDDPDRRKERRRIMGEYTWDRIAERDIVPRLRSEFGF